MSKTGVLALSTYFIVVFTCSFKVISANLSDSNIEQKYTAEDFETSNSNSTATGSGIGTGLRNLNAVTATESTSVKDIHFYLYSDPSHPKRFHEIIVNDVSTLDKVNLSPGQIKLLGPGFAGVRRGLNIIKDAYLQAGVTNVVIVDYAKLVRSSLPAQELIGWFSFFGSLRNVPKIGTRGAEFLNFMVKNNKIKDVGDVHIIGESLGAHIAYSIARIAYNKYDLTVGRITGLDPAGPFSKQLGKNKLAKKYAKFVDAIHTDIDAFGTPESLGHVDFYVNGGLGKSQPDCRFLGPILVIPCAHGLSSPLFHLSVTKQKEFYGCPCKKTTSKSMPCGKNTKCDNPILLGENTPTEARGNYYVEVANKILQYEVKPYVEEVISE